MSDQVLMTTPAIWCTQQGNRVACTLDLTDKGVSRQMLEEVLSGLVARTPNATGLHQEWVPAFVDAIILEAVSCNQLPELEDVVHTLIENKPTPVQVRILIEGIDKYRAAVGCPNGTVLEVSNLRKHYLEHKVKTIIGRIWSRIQEAVGGHEDGYWEEQHSANAATGPRG